ncbi:hypothetical protein HJC23_006296, partial [Cyclotella cryptica]
FAQEDDNDLMMFISNVAASGTSNTNTSRAGYAGCESSDSMYAKLLLEASVKIGDKLDFAVGKGNDGDVPKVSFIMDSKEFPFFVAEQYHQFHDGFIWGEDYPLSYNSLASKFAKTEDFGWCSNGLVRIGIGGL